VEYICLNISIARNYIVHHMNERNLQLEQVVEFQYLRFESLAPNDAHSQQLRSKALTLTRLEHLVVLKTD